MEFTLGLVVVVSVSARILKKKNNKMYENENEKKINKIRHAVISELQVV